MKLKKYMPFIWLIIAMIVIFSMGFYWGYYEGYVRGIENLIAVSNIYDSLGGLQ